MMLTLLDIITILISVILAYRNYHKFKYSARYLIYNTFVLLYVVPIFLDLSLGWNEYDSSRLNGFILARNDKLTTIIYDIFVVYSQLMLLYYKKDKYGYNSIYYNSLKLGVDVIPKGVIKYLWLGCVLAPLWMYYNSGTEYLLFYQWRELRISDLPRGYSLAETLSYIGVTSSVLLVFIQNSNRSIINTLSKILAFFFLYMNICVQGKRAILFFALINVVSVYIFFIGFKSNRSKFQKAIVKLSGFLAVIFIAMYMVSTSLMVYVGRGGDTAHNITHMRIDFFRDDRVRMAMYAELHPDNMKITDYPLQTIPDDILTIFPLNFLQSRLDRTQVVYQTRFTYALSEVKTSQIAEFDKERYSFMTVTMLAEIISNIGLLLGFIFIPIVLLYFAGLLNRFPCPYNMLIFNFYFLLNLFDFSYVSLYIEIVVCLIYFSRRKIKRQIFYLS